MRGYRGRYPLLTDEDLLSLVGAGDAFAETWRKYRRDRVREALEDLPHTQHKVLALAHFSERTNAEIAERLHLPLGTVKGRIRLGLKKLRNHSELREMAVGEPPRRKGGASGPRRSTNTPPWTIPVHYSPECVEDPLSANFAVTQFYEVRSV